MYDLLRYVLFPAFIDIRFSAVSLYVWLLSGPNVRSISVLSVAVRLGFPPLLLAFQFTLLAHASLSSVEEIEFPSCRLYRELEFKECVAHRNENAHSFVEDISVSDCLQNTWQARFT